MPTQFSSIKWVHTVVQPPPHPSPPECSPLVKLNLITRHPTLHGSSQTLSAAILLSVSINVTTLDNLMKVACIVFVIRWVAYFTEHSPLQVYARYSVTQDFLLFKRRIACRVFHPTRMPGFAHHSSAQRRWAAPTSWLMLLMLLWNWLCKHLSVILPSTLGADTPKWRSSRTYS